MKTPPRKWRSFIFYGDPQQEESKPQPSGLSAKRQFGKKPTIWLFRQGVSSFGETRKDSYWGYERNPLSHEVISCMFHLERIVATQETNDTSQKITENIELIIQTALLLFSPSSFQNQKIDRNFIKEAATQWENLDTQ